MRYWLVLLIAGCYAAVPAAGAERRVTLPLVDGKLSMQTLEKGMVDDLRLPVGMVEKIPFGHGGINMRGVAGWVAVRAMESSLGDGFSITVSDDAMVIQVDTAKLPANWDQTCDAAARFAEAAAPQATQRQSRRWGLMLPGTVDVKRPLVVLIHGIDGDADSCGAMSDLLRQNGNQVGVFCYPSERPIGESADLLGEKLRAAQARYPGLHIDLVTQSMGGLVARDYVEGEKYGGGVDHLIMIAPPNGGSAWAYGSPVLKLAVNAHDAVMDKDWSGWWMVTEGICQSGRDLLPGSKFLKDLNARPRRAGVAYTIIAGDATVETRIGADALAKVGLERGAALLRNTHAPDDGAVSLESARLAGVDDFVAVHADHQGLFKCEDGNPPAAWGVVRERIK